jgi:hypothetical protein
MPHYNGLPVSWRTGETAGDHDRSEIAKPQDQGKSPDVHTTELPKDVTLRHVLDDYPVDNTTNIADGKQHRSLSHSLVECPVNSTHSTAGAKQQRRLSHSLDSCASDSASNAVDSKQHRSLPESLSDCAADGMATTNEVDVLSTNVAESTLQHLMHDCAIDNITIVTNPTSAEEASQHHLAECAQTVADPKPAGPATLEQHAISEYAVIGDAQSSKAPTHDQHKLNDCAIICDAPVPETSGDNSNVAAAQSHQSHDHLRFDQAIEQNDSHTVTITVPQPPVIIVTSTDALEDL